MANGDSNTSTKMEIKGNQKIIAGSVADLLKIPLSTRQDLFQVLDVCQRYADELIETDDHAEYMALCGRLLAGLNVLKAVLKLPLPAHLIEQLTVKERRKGAERGLPQTESDLACDYCAALTVVLLNQQVSQRQQVHIAGLLFEMLDMLAEDLKAPRFMRTAKGLAMLGGETVPGIH